MRSKGLVFVLFVHLCYAVPEQGKWTDLELMKLKEGSFIYGFSKVSYNATTISTTLNCSASGDKPVKVKISWLLRFSNCSEEYSYNEEKEKVWKMYLDEPRIVPFEQLHYTHVRYANASGIFECEKNMDLPLTSIPFIIRKTLNDDAGGEDNETLSQPDSGKSVRDKEKENEGDKSTKKTTTVGVKIKPTSKPLASAKPPPSKRRKRKAENPPKTTTTTKSPSSPKPSVKPPPPKTCVEKHKVHETWENGNYLFVLFVEPVLPADAKKIKTVKASVEMYFGPCEDKQFLSAIDWPFLPFYGVLCALYTFYAIGWLLMLACFWRDLLRIQFWIGGVIFLGMLEKAMYEAEYRSIDQTGQSVKGLIIMAELTSCLKRALARMLVVIVSVGFGIVKPRLGPTLHKVLGVGGLYFILASVEACIRVTRPKYDQSKQAMIAYIPLMLLEFAIAWWTFASLLQTTRTLRLRRNVVKLSLYRHFTNTLIFAVLASLAFIVWVIKMRFEEGSCLQDAWSEKWLDDAYWHLLFAVILLVIIILWRPSQNNQRYAFSPLLDAADEDDEPVMNDAFEGMKMRGTKSSGPKEPQSKVEEDLKWIEENIPASVADTALPSLLDSDEEIMTTKFELSKME